MLLVEPCLSSLDGDGGRTGKDVVRSKLDSCDPDGESMEDSVLERANIRFASLVGDCCDEDGNTALNIWDRSRTGVLETCSSD